MVGSRKERGRERESVSIKPFALIHFTSTRYSAAAAAAVLFFGVNKCFKTFSSRLSIHWHIYIRRRTSTHTRTHTYATM